eukprot:scaffold48_cov311-Pinguiococcus_pyrenoidosus.AAC.327
MGMCRYRDGEAYTIADIPGLIGGASENRGMGHSFLRHIERTRLLLYVIDVSTYHEFETLPAEASEVPPPSAQFQLLRHELRQYSPSLLGKRCMIVANKIDVDGMSRLPIPGSADAAMRMAPPCAALTGMWSRL